MNILLVGPQGSGKGTQAKLLCQKYKFFYFEMGGFLRNIAQKNQEVKKMLKAGILVPDEEATSYVTSHLDNENIYNDIIFDGFPRTLTQYKFLKNWLLKKQVKIDVVFVIEIPESESIKRLSARRINPLTGEIYNLITNKPSNDVDISTLVQRDDDKPEAIKKRLEIYNLQTKELIETMKKDTTIIEVDGMESINAIHTVLLGHLESLRKNE